MYGQVSALNFGGYLYSEVNLSHLAFYESESFHESETESYGILCPIL